MRKILLLLGAAAAWAAGGVLDLDAVRDALMAPNGVAARDVDLFPPLAKPDPFRLSRVTSVLHNPFLLDTVIAEVMARTAPDSAALPVNPDSLWPLLDAPVAVAGAAGAFSPRAALEDIRKGLAEQAADLSPKEKDFLYMEASSMFLQNEEDTTLNPIQAELRRLEEDAKIHRLMDLALRLRREPLMKASGAAWRLETWLIAEFRAGRGDKAIAAMRGVPGFPVHVSGKGNDHLRPDRGIWIDEGGDDVYDLAPVGKPGQFLLVLDLGGDDLYMSKDSLFRSAGNMGISLTADLGGNDHYLGSNFAFGSALFGYSHLFDAKGSDYYEGRCASLGFAAFGMGILQDEAGGDTYSASLLSEGASSTLGLGALLDRAGDDRYLARPTFLDDLRYNDHFIQMVQGFSTGSSPDFSGGIGILRDTRGNDYYLADIFGQGSAYWYSLGLLLDESGDDRYEAHQYAQGAGVHIAVGAAVDWAGNDRRASKGVSQGCGHDFGFGLLYDKAGDDAYLATDMSQGGGSANGLGILQDAAGNDVYQSLNPDMTLGHADMRRDRGSFGFFLDGGGKDKYAIRADSAAWRVFNGKTKGNGFGIDLPDAAAIPRGADSGVAAATDPHRGSALPAVHDAARFPVPKKDTLWKAPALSHFDSLFIAAATGEPRFQAVRDSSEKLLAAAGGEMLDYLLAHRLTEQTPRQRHYIERLFALVADSGRNRVAVEKLAGALKTAPDSLKPQLLYIGSEMKDSGFLPVARTLLRSDSVEVRKMAVRSLGCYPDTADLKALFDGLDKTEGLERQQRLWAISRFPALKDWPRLIPLLKDPYLYNRQWVRQILVKAAGDWPTLVKQIPPAASAAPGDKAQKMEWVLMAADSPGPAAKNFIKQQIRLLDPARKKFLLSELGGL
jgi:hypothetical protein